MFHSSDSHQRVQEEHKDTEEFIWNRMHKKRDTMKDHLFISYATEDADLAEWLSLKLTSEGYAIWCDRFKLLGGESYPRDIDEAIKTKTFRVLALLSHFSLSKDNPRKERTLALSIGRERGIDFLIPLNVDGLRSAELDWMTSDITFIPFNRSWARGLAQLLKKLESINAPRPVEDGKEIASSVYLNHSILREEPETIYSNCLEFLKIPSTIKEFVLEKPLSDNEIQIFSDRWAFYRKDPEILFSFVSPPGADIFSCQLSHSHDWREQEKISGIITENIVSNLLKKSLLVKCFRKGLRRSRVGKIYFPFGLLESDKLHFTGYKEKKTWILVAGERTSPYYFKYHLCPSFRIKKEDGRYLCELFVDLYLTDSSDEPLRSSVAHSRHKAIRKNWWNNHLLNRNLAICEFLTSNNGNIVIGESEEQIILSGSFIRFECPVRLDERMLTDLRENEADDLFKSVEDEEMEAEE